MKWRIGLVVLFAAAAARADEPKEDLASGKDIYGTCAACHGANGEGGQGGEYPRVAGQPKGFTVNQLKSFQKRVRLNIPMFPYTEPRELSDRDMRDVAAFLAAIDLPSKAPVFDEKTPALDRLLAMEKVMIVPRVEGDLENGKKVYRRRCAACHGHHGRGKKDFPRLVGQYPNYLQRQIDSYLKAARPHDSDEAGEGVLKKLSAKDVTDVLAWLTSIQDDSALEPDREEDAKKDQER